MNAEDIPDDCIADPQFVQILTATLSAEIATNEKLLKVYTGEIRSLKQIISKEVQCRKNIKMQIKENKERKAVMEPLLDQLSRSECKRITELNLLKNQLDEVSLRKQSIQANYKKILDNYRETWNRYKAEYEEFEFAVMRKECKIELEKLKIKFMMKQYEKLECHNILKQRKIINDKRIQSVIVKSSEMILNRWKEQNYAYTLNNNIVNAQEELKKIIEEGNKLRKYLENEVKTSISVKQQIPIPRLNTSLVRSLYIDKNSLLQHLKIHKYRPKQIIDPDTVSINSVMFEEMCKKDENIELNPIYDNLEYEEQKEKDMEQSSVQRELDNQDAKNDTVNTFPELNNETLEHICSQLSINDDEKCNDQSNENIQQNPSHLTSESFSKSQASREKSFKEITNPLKHKASTESSNVNDNEQPQKKPKLPETLKFSPMPLSSVIQYNSCDEMYLSVTNLQLDKEKIQSAPTIGSLPQIRKIETITQPTTVQIKPPMAEVPPRPSSLFSPRHYEQTYTSVGNLSYYFDNNYNDPIQEIYNLDNCSENWHNLSPPQADSEISFSSVNTSVQNHIPNNNTLNFMTQSEKTATNNFNFFNRGSTNPNSLF